MHRGLITALALAAALVCASDVSARTIYVNAKRPNNKGNGFKVNTAKKTIQAAINIAKKGDTILVYPGTYAPIKTNNKKITIKSVKGQKKTKIVPKANTWTVADLAKTEAAGNATVLSGFMLDGLYQSHGLYQSRDIGVRCGTVKSCTIQNLGVAQQHQLGYSSEAHAAENAFLFDCTIKGCRFYATGGAFIKECTLQRCKVQGNESDSLVWVGCPLVSDSRLYNCLISGNKHECRDAMFSNSTLINSTVAKNTFGSDRFTEESRFHNCILWENRGQNSKEVTKTGPHTEHGYYNENGAWVVDEEEWDEGYYDGNNNWVAYDYQDRTVNGPYTVWEKVTRIHNVDPDNTYKNTDKTNKNPKLTSAYKPKKGSYVINKGKLTKTQKKLVGTKDLAGKKRIKGKAIDRGCYEY